MRNVGESRERSLPRLRGWLTQQLGFETGEGPDLKKELKASPLDEETRRVFLDQLGRLKKTLDIPKPDEDFSLGPFPEGRFPTGDQFKSLIVKFYKDLGFELSDEYIYENAGSVVYGFRSADSFVEVILTRPDPSKAWVTVVSVPVY